MLILCYGIMKSGSTLAFELVKGMLENVGHPQTRLPDGPVDAARRQNYISSLDEDRIDALLAAIGDRWVAVKTHAGFDDQLFPRLEDLQARRAVQIIASYRDPRDICLSLMDAGAKARARGVPTFAKMRDLDSAVSRVREQLPKFRKWASVNGTLRLNYETVAFASDEAIDLIEHRLNIVCDRAVAKKHAFEEAFTQRNKAKSERFREEFTPSQNAQLLEAFGPFIRDVCERDDQAWFANHRKRVMSRIGAVKSSPA